MQKSDDNQKAKTTHRQVRTSTTLNRKYVKRPESNSQPINMVKVNMRMKKRTETPVVAEKMTAKELKDRAIAKALQNAAKPEKTEVAMKHKSKSSKGLKVHFGAGRILLALGCAAAAVAAIVYFVNLNMPDISLKVAAMQTGIEASYPSYVPRDFSLSDITSESGKVTLNFKNSGTGDAFTIIEERSSWDSNALLTNYVKDAYGEDYSLVREQGLTLYIHGSSATWVNGGILFKLNTISGSLTKKQIRAIAVSL